MEKLQHIFSTDYPITQFLYYFFLTMERHYVAYMSRIRIQVIFVLFCYCNYEVIWLLKIDDSNIYINIAKMVLTQHNHIVLLNVTLFNLKKFVCFKLELYKFTMNIKFKIRKICILSIYTLYLPCRGTNLLQSTLSFKSLF